MAKSKNGNGKRNGKRKPSKSLVPFILSPGPPEFQVCWPAVDAVLEVFGGLEDCAVVLRCDIETLRAACRREQGMEFSTYMQQKHRVAKLSLRRRQLQVATGYFLEDMVPLYRMPVLHTDRKGDPQDRNRQAVAVAERPLVGQDGEGHTRTWIPPDKTMLIWTGKQYLGQEDKPGIPGLLRARAELAVLLGLDANELPTVQAGELAEETG